MSTQSRALTLTGRRAPPLPFVGALRNWSVGKTLVAPAVIYAIIVTQLPFVLTVWYSLLRWNLLRPDNVQFAGIDNYLFVATADPVFWSALVNTIILTAGRAAISTTIERVAGYRRALHKAGIAVDDRLVVSGASTSEGGALAANTVLDLKDPPSAIFSGNNLMSIGALQAIVSRGLLVPEDVALVGFDDFPFPWSDAFRPHLTTIAQPTYELGRRAAEILVQHLKGLSSLAPERVVLEGKLVVRESSGALSPRRRLA